MKKEAQILLKDQTIENLLKAMILEKANRYDEVIFQIISEEDENQLLNGDITPEIIRKLLLNHELKEEKVILERDLSSMCFQLNKARKRISENTIWAQAYEFSTKIVRIEDVISHFLGITQFNRNISCPCHEDSTPSFRVNIKNNRFICFGCGIRGSPIDFVMKYKNCSFKEAVLYLSTI